MSDDGGALSRALAELQETRAARDRWRMAYRALVLTRADTLAWLAAEERDLATHVPIAAVREHMPLPQDGAE